MKKIRLENGLKIIIEKRNTDSVTLGIGVKVGSNYENKKVGGISHFVEHMLFEGTKKRSALEIGRAIDRIGGELNAATLNEKTFFYASILGKYFDIALDVLSDIIQNPIFDEKSLEKERKVILEEIKMYTDNPIIYQWILFIKSLYNKHTVKNPIYGAEKSVSSIAKKDIIDFYKSHYQPKNMVIVIVGNAPKDVIPKVKHAFANLKNVCPTIKKNKIKEPEQKKIEEVAEKKIISQSYVVLGYKCVERAHKDSYAIDIIDTILGHGSSSRLFNELRTKRGLVYQIGSHYEAGTDYGFFGVSFSIGKQNIEKAKELILAEFEKIKNGISNKELKDAKNLIEGSYKLENEDNKKMADLLFFWDVIKSAELGEEYIKQIKKITNSNIKRVARKYFNRNYTIAVIEQGK